jgi:hypothetical protein
VARSVRVCDISELSLVPSTSMQSSNHDFFLCWCYVLRWIWCLWCYSECMYIHTGQAWKICLATVRMEPTTFGIPAQSSFGIYTHKTKRDFVWNLITSSKYLTFNILCEYWVACCVFFTIV